MPPMPTPAMFSLSDAPKARRGTNMAAGAASAPRRDRPEMSFIASQANTRLPWPELEAQAHAEAARAGLIADGAAVHVAGAGDDAEAGRIREVGAGITPVRMVEDVGRRGFVAQTGVLVEIEILDQPHVPDVDARPDDRAASGTAEGAGGGRRKCARVEPLRGSALAGRQVGVRHQVRAHGHFGRIDGVRIGNAHRIGAGPQRCKELARLPAEYGGYLPPARDQLRRPSGAAEPVFAMPER